MRLLALVDPPAASRKALVRGWADPLKLCAELNPSVAARIYSESRGESRGPVPENTPVDAQDVHLTSYVAHQFRSALIFSLESSTTLNYRPVSIFQFLIRVDPSEGLLSSHTFFPPAKLPILSAAVTAEKSTPQSAPTGRLEQLIRYCPFSHAHTAHKGRKKTEGPNTSKPHTST